MNDFIMPMGKHKDKTLSEINNEDPSYLEWVYHNFNETDKSEEIKDAIEEFLEI
tara:strand:- start:155 stop:316 length:162 start_codon:yes stop_codon:yes gene_type:complete